MNAPRDGTAWGGWLMYVALAACPLSKIVAAGLIGGSITATLLNPWFLVLVLIPVIAAAIAVIRRVHRHRRPGGETWEAAADHDKPSAER